MSTPDPRLQYPPGRPLQAVRQLLDALHHLVDGQRAGHQWVSYAEWGLITQVDTDAKTAMLHTATWEGDVTYGLNPPAVGDWQIGYFPNTGTPWIKTTNRAGWLYWLTWDTHTSGQATVWRTAWPLAATPDVVSCYTATITDVTELCLVGVDRDGTLCLAGTGGARGLGSLPAPGWLRFIADQGAGAVTQVNLPVVAGAGALDTVAPAADTQDMLLVSALVPQAGAPGVLIGQLLAYEVIPSPGPLEPFDLYSTPYMRYFRSNDRGATWVEFLRHQYIDAFWAPAAGPGPDFAPARRLWTQPLGFVVGWIATAAEAALLGADAGALATTVLAWDYGGLERAAGDGIAPSGVTVTAQIITQAGSAIPLTTSLTGITGQLPYLYYAGVAVPEYRVLRADDGFDSHIGATPPTTYLGRSGPASWATYGAAGTEYAPVAFDRGLQNTLLSVYDAGSGLTTWEVSTDGLQTRQALTSAQLAALVPTTMQPVRGGATIVAAT